MEHSGTWAHGRRGRDPRQMSMADAWPIETLPPQRIAHGDSASTTCRTASVQAMESAAHCGPSDAKRRAGAMGYHAGVSAEAQVAAHYQRSGRGIAARRWRGRSGEIDLIAREGDGLVFIEVKKSRDFARAAERVTPRQMQRICAAASEYLSDTPRGQLTDVRFDVALVNGRGEIDILENAFGA